jgi:hypothetical protein
VAAGTPAFIILVFSGENTGESQISMESFVYFIVLEKKKKKEKREYC